MKSQAQNCMDMSGKLLATAASGHWLLLLEQRSQADLCPTLVSFWLGCRTVWVYFCVLMQKEADLQQSWKSAVSAAWGWSSYSLAAYSSADMHVMLWVVPWERFLAEWCLPERPLPPTSVNYALQIYHHIFSTQVSFMVLKMSLSITFPCQNWGSSNGNLDQSCYDLRAETDLCSVTVMILMALALGIICLSLFFWLGSSSAGAVIFSAHFS